MTTRVTDILRAPDTHANRPAATAVPSGAVYPCSTHNLIYRSDGSAWATWAALVPPGGSTNQVLAKASATDYDLAWVTSSGGGGSSGFQKATRTAGDVSIASTSWTNVDTGLDLTISGVAAGDVVEYIPNFLVDSTNGASTILSFDVATIVSAAVVNYFGTAASGGNGIMAWYAPGTANFSQVGGSAFYTLQSGDISSGSVTLRLRTKGSSATARKVLASTGNMLQVAARKVV